jgi:hypothetical protein
VQTGLTALMLQQTVYIVTAWLCRVATGWAVAKCKCCYMESVFCVNVDKITGDIQWRSEFH